MQNHWHALYPTAIYMCKEVQRLKKMNIEHRTSNIEFWIRKDELLDDILQETEEFIKIFVTSIKTASGP